MRWFVVLAFASLIIACRAVVGIDDIVLLDAGSMPRADGGGSSSSSSSGGTACVAGNNCIDCCRTTYASGYDKLVMVANRCACSSCTAQACATTDQCGGNVSPPPPLCNSCLNETFANGMSCNVQRNTCMNDTACKPALTCLQGCAAH